MSYLQSINEDLKLESSFYRLLGTNYKITYQLHEPQTLTTLFDREQALSARGPTSASSWHCS